MGLVDQENRRQSGASFQLSISNKIKVDQFDIQREHLSSLGSFILDGSTSSFNIIEYILAKNSLGKFRKS